jgi:hypothetical protein
VITTEAGGLPMETLIASEIEPGATALEPRTPAARAIVEIGPYDLPEPPGGWVDLVLDDDEDVAADGGAAAPDAAAAAGPEAGSVPAAPPPTFVREGRSRAARAASAAASRWFLVPEALVVAGFVLLGGALLAGLVLFRTPRAPGEPRDSVSAPVEVTDPSPGYARRRAGRGASAAARSGREAQAVPAAEAETGIPGISPPPDVEPIGPDSPLDPESPPAPRLAPWRGPG